jgi:stage V sporulation protein R
MPLMYQHWSFGKRFIYRGPSLPQGGRGLAYELVINSNPCITYLMEENTMAMQTLVTAHAAFGHNHFFKNNYLFASGRMPAPSSAIWISPRNTSPNARNDMASMPWKILDSAHALMDHGVFRYRRPPRLSSEKVSGTGARAAGIRRADL